MALNIPEGHRGIGKYNAPTPGIEPGPPAWAFQKYMNNSCVVIGVAANMTQWTPPGCAQKTDNRDILHFRASIVPDFSETENEKE